MNFKPFIPVILCIIVFFSSLKPAIAQQKERGFSLKRLFGISPQTEEVNINHHFQFHNLSEWSEESEEFYRNRDFKPAWFENGSLNRQGEKLIEKMKSAWEDALPEPAIYLAKVEDAMIRMHKRSAGKISTAEIISDADVNLTLAWFDYAAKLSSGILNPADLNVIWEVLPENPDYVKILEDDLRNGGFGQSFDHLRPEHEQYELLLQAFKDLLEIRSSGGWPLPGFFPLIKENDSDANVIRLKEFLLATGDLQENDSSWVNAPIFDNRLTQAVKKFQYRHGLKQDGIVGNATLQHMNVPLDYRLDQIRLNIDRIRWLPDDFGDNHIIINIPDFAFEYHQDGEKVKEMDVVVGENENYTPVLEDTLYSIIFNPAWNVPNSIATNEIFPKILEDSTYMERNQYSVLRDSYVSGDTINHLTFDWSEVPRDSFPFFVVQHPGPLNSLGRVQFMLENQYSIFLHDTPANHLFNIEQRDFSHGCVRLERPADLAITLLKEQLPTDSITRYLSEQDKKIVYLEEKIPVHLIYQTTWVDETELLHFREDIYGFDKLSMPALQRNFPEAVVLKEE